MSNHAIGGRSYADPSAREMQLFLIGYIIIEICEIFTVGRFPLNNKVQIVSSLFRCKGTKLTLNRLLLVYTSA